jgi:hypothetical protein
MSEVDDIPDALKAQRRALQWLAATARRDDDALDVLDDAIGDDLAGWANLAGALASIAERVGVEHYGGTEAWMALLVAEARTAFDIEDSADALGALSDQVRAGEGGGSDSVPPAHVDGAHG